MHTLLYRTQDLDTALGWKVILGGGIRLANAVEEKYGEYMWTKSISNESRGLMMNSTSFISIFAPIYFKNIVDCRKIKPECFHSPS